MNQRTDNLERLFCQQALAHYPDAKPDAEIEAQLKRLRGSDLSAFSDGDSNLAQSAVAGLWLLHGFLDQSHSISQSIATAEGSFWHAIMHRLERDFWNSKYWYRQVGRHAVFKQIAERLGHPVGSWNPAEFVDQCEKASDQRGHDIGKEKVDQQLQQIAVTEWLALFQYCLPRLDTNLPFSGQL